MFCYIINTLFAMKVTKDSNDIYHSHKSISSSGLKTIVNEGLDYYLNGPKFTETAAMKLGTAIHTAILEPELYDDLYYEMPFIENGRTKEGIALKKEALEKSEGRIMLKHDEHIKVKEILKRYNDNSKMSNLAKHFCRGDVELSHYLKLDGIDVRVRPDVINREKNFITDVKSCQNSNPKAFKYDIIKRKYHVQAAFYMDCLGITDFRFVCCMTNAPYAVTVIKLEDHHIDEGRMLYKTALNKWRDYLEKGIISGPIWNDLAEDGSYIV